MPVYKFDTKLMAERMEARGLTQRALAAKLDVHPTCVSNWLAGTRAKDPNHVSQIARLLGVPASKLARQAKLRPTKRRSTAKRPPRAAVATRSDKAATLPAKEYDTLKSFLKKGQEICLLNLGESYSLSCNALSEVFNHLGRARQVFDKSVKRDA